VTPKMTCEWVGVPDTFLTFYISRGWKEIRERPCNCGRSSTTPQQNLDVLADLAVQLFLITSKTLPWFYNKRLLEIMWDEIEKVSRSRVKMNLVSAKQDKFTNPELSEKW